MSIARDQAHQGAASALVDIWRSFEATVDTDIYDEVLLEVSDRARLHRSIGKADIGALVVWKRLNASTRWARTLMSTPEAEVREATSVAWELANDLDVPIPQAGGAARRHLSSVPGLGGTGAIASAVLVALSPHRMAVWDKRVSAALRAIGRSPAPGNGRYERYLETVITLADELRVVGDLSRTPTPREIDLVLFRAGGDSALIERLTSHRPDAGES